MNLEVFELASSLVMSLYNKKGEKKKDFSVYNNGLRENQKTKITNLGIGLTKKGIYLSGAWLTFSMIWGRFSVRILLQTCPSMDLPRAGRETVNLS